MKLRRLRKFILITGTTLSVMIAVTFVLSGSYPVCLKLTGQGPTVGVVEGCWFIAWIRIGSGTFFTIPTGALHQHRMPSWELWNQWSVLGLTPGRVFIPLYGVFAAVAIPTLLIWRFVPKFPRGHCRRCGYNLTGLREARCPECGTGFDASSR